MTSKRSSKKIEQQRVSSPDESAFLVDNGLASGVVFDSEGEESIEHKKHKKTVKTKERREKSRSPSSKTPASFDLENTAKKVVFAEEVIVTEMESELSPSKRKKKKDEPKKNDMLSGTKDTNEEFIERPPVEKSGKKKKKKDEDIVTASVVDMSEEKIARRKRREQEKRRQRETEERLRLVESELAEKNKLLVEVQTMLSPGRSASTVVDVVSIRAALEKQSSINKSDKAIIGLPVDSESDTIDAIDDTVESDAVDTMNTMEAVDAMDEVDKMDAVGTVGSAESDIADAIESDAIEMESDHDDAGHLMCKLAAQLTLEPNLNIIRSFREKDSRSNTDHSSTTQYKCLLKYPVSKLHEKYQCKDGVSVFINKVRWEMDDDGIESWDESLLYSIPKYGVRIVNELSPVVCIDYLQDGYDNIWLSAKRGDIEAIEFFVNQGVSVHEVDSHEVDELDSTWIGNLYLCASKSTAGHSPLYWACVMAQHETVKYLLENGAKDTDFDCFDSTKEPSIIEILKSFGFKGSRDIDFESMTEEEKEKLEKIRARREEMSRTHEDEEESSPKTPTKDKKKKLFGSSWGSRSNTDSEISSGGIRERVAEVANKVKCKLTGKKKV